MQSLHPGCGNTVGTRLLMDCFGAGYSTGALFEIEDAWYRIARASVIMDHPKRVLDDWALRLLEEYDKGLRGDDLLAWFWAMLREITAEQYGARYDPTLEPC